MAHSMAKRCIHVGCATEHDTGTKHLRHWALNVILAGFYMRSPDDIGQEEVEEYLLYLKKFKNYTASTRNQITCGLKFFYNETLKRDDMVLRLPRKRPQKKLPEILSMDEVARLLQAPSNIKHRALLKTAYSGGLRVSELVVLKPEHIDSGRMLIRVEQGKGRKDRYTLLSENLLPELRHYYRSCKPKTWLFPSRSREEHLSDRTAQRIYGQREEESGNKKGKGHPYLETLCRVRNYAEFTIIHRLSVPFIHHVLAGTCFVARHNNRPRLEQSA